MLTTLAVNTFCEVIDTVMVDLVMCHFFAKPPKILKPELQSTLQTMRNKIFSTPSMICFINSVKISVLLLATTVCSLTGYRCVYSAKSLRRLMEKMFSVSTINQTIPTENISLRCFGKHGHVAMCSAAC